MSLLDQATPEERKAIIGIMNVLCGIATILEARELGQNLVDDLVENSKVLGIPLEEMIMNLMESRRDGISVKI